MDHLHLRWWLLCFSSYCISKSFCTHLAKCPLTLVNVLTMVVSVTVCIRVCVRVCVTCISQDMSQCHCQLLRTMQRRSSIHRVALLELQILRLLLELKLGSMLWRTWRWMKLLRKQLEALQQCVQFAATPCESLDGRFRCWLAGMCGTRHAWRMLGLLEDMSQVGALIVVMCAMQLQNLSYPLLLVISKKLPMVSKQSHLWNLCHRVRFLVLQGVRQPWCCEA